MIIEKFENFLYELLIMLFICVVAVGMLSLAAAERVSLFALVVIYPFWQGALKLAS